MVRKRLFIGLGAMAAVFLILLVVGGIYLTQQLTDDKLNARLTQLLNDNFGGSFELGRVHWQPLAGVQIDNLVVKSPAGLPVATLGHLDTEVALMSLLTGKLVVDHVNIQAIRIDLILPPGSKTPQLVQALFPEFELPPIRDIHVPLRVELRNVHIEQVDFAVKGQPDLRARVADLDIHDASVWLQKDMLGLSLTLTALARLHDGDVRVQVPSIRLRLDDTQVKFSTFEVWLKELDLELPGVHLSVNGYAQASETGLERGNARGQLHFDTEDATLRGQVPAIVRDGLRGNATLHFTGQHQGKSARGELTLREDKFEMRGMPIKSLQAQAELHGINVQLKKFDLELGTGNLHAEGHADLQPAENILLGQHAVKIKAHELPVRSLAGQFVGLPALLPQTLSFAATSNGRALWPPTSEVSFDVVPEGLPGENWPGLPKTMELKGRFLTHPDLLEILKLEVDVDKLPSFGIQGALPFEEQSIVELIEELHLPHPNSPLHRIPLAPTDLRPEEDARQ